MHSRMHYALAWSDVFTFDYSSAGLQFGKETWSFVQDSIRILPTLPDAQRWRVGRHFRWLNLITNILQQGSSITLSDWCRKGDTKVFILLKLDAWTLRINDQVDPSADGFWLKDLKVVFKHLKTRVPSRDITCDYVREGFGRDYSSCVSSGLWMNLRKPSLHQPVNTF